MADPMIRTVLAVDASESINSIHSVAGPAPNQQKSPKKVVTAVMNVYQKCDFKWRWHNLEYDDSDARAHEFNRS